MAKSDDNILISTAIPYLTGDPHLGTAMDAVYADCLARYYKAQGNNVVFTLGTDEYGQKNYRKAQESGQEPEEFFGREVQKFIAMYAQLQAKYTHFTRTSADDYHRSAVTQIWERLTPYLYKDQYIGKYDVKQEQFIGAEEAREMQQQDPERYASLEDVAEENYYFKLSSFADVLREKISSDEMEVIPKRAKNEILGLIDQKLKDMSFTRPKSKVQWGIEVPRDPEQVMYVWVDALSNYISVLGYPDGEMLQEFWPANVQVMGKDIIRFHATIWPAMLLALELPLPKKLYAHGVISLDGQQMSKSTGVILEPKDVIDRFGSDVLRYYILRHIPSHSDGDFSWQKITDSYNGELANDLGNLVSRVAKMITQYQAGIIGPVPEPEHDVRKYDKAFEEMRFDKALDFVFEKVRALNSYIEREKPWEIAKSGDQQHLSLVLSHLTGNLLQIGMLIEPFMPMTGERIKTIFQGTQIQFDGQPLFPRVELRNS